MKGKQRIEKSIKGNLREEVVINNEVKNISMTKWPYKLKVVNSKDISRSNLLEIRVSENTINLMGISNGTQCIIINKEKCVCVSLRTLDSNIKFNDNQGLIGELVCENLSIIDKNEDEILIMPLRSYIKEKEITGEMCKHAIISFYGIIDINNEENNNMKKLNKNFPKYVKDNKSIQKLIISRSRGHCVLQGNIIPIQVASNIYYFRVFEFNRDEELKTNYNKVIKLGNQTKIELIFDDNNVNLNNMNCFNSPKKIVDYSKSGINNRKYGLDKIGGMNYLKQEILKCIINPLKFSNIYSSFGIRPIKGILLYGPPGTGKTLVARCIAEEIELIEMNGNEINKKRVVDFIVIDGSTLNLGNYDEDDDFFKSINKIKENSKNKEYEIYSILFIDEIDMICGNRDSFTGVTQQNKKYTTTLLSLLDGFNENNHIILIAATNKPNDIDPALRRAGRIDREICVEVPTSAERKDILKLILSDIPNNLNDSELDLLVNETQAFVGADLKMLINESINTFLERNNLKRKELIDNITDIPLLSYEDVYLNVKNIKPSALRELSIEIPKTYWKDIGGYEEVKEQLRECVEWPLIHHDLFELMNIKPPSGILLYGPPGCSKTLMAKAVATESKMNFISVKGPELFSKWVGESEKSIREIFRKARQNSPCVIFFDEIDAIGNNRETSPNTSDVSSRVLSQMLNEMDGITSNKQVVVIGATNRPDLLDSALLRPGRLDRIIYIGLPDSKAREKILNIYLKPENYSNDINNNSDFNQSLDSNVNNSNSYNERKQEKSFDEICDEIRDMQISNSYNEMINTLVNLTNGYSGAELALLCRETMMQVIRRTIINYHETNNSEELISKKNLIIKGHYFTWKDINTALNKVKPRIPDSLIQFYENYNKNRFI